MSDIDQTESVVCCSCGEEILHDSGVINVRHKSFSEDTVPVCQKCYAALFDRFPIEIIFFYAAVGVMGLVTLYNSYVSGIELDPIGTLYVHISLFLFFQIVCIIPHELGHAIAARTLGLKLQRICFGSGKTIWKFQIFDVDIEFKIYPFGGTTFYRPVSMRFIRTKHFITALAGPLANVVMALFVCIISPPTIWVIYKFEPGTIFLLSSLVVFIDNLWPRTYQSERGLLETDGLHLLKAHSLSDDDLRAWINSEES